MTNKYTVIIDLSNQRRVERFPEDVKRRSGEAIEALAYDPRPPGSKKLKGRYNQFRVRVGSYRVIYSIDDAELLVTITLIEHRSRVYER